MPEKNETPWSIEGQWHTSPINFTEELRATMPYMQKRIHVRHAFREEEECGCVGYLMKDKIAVACATSDIGVEEIDMGYSNHPYQVESLRATKAAFDATGRTTPLMITTRGPSYEEYIHQVDLSVEAGADVVGIIGPGSRDPDLMMMILDWINENLPSHVKIFTQYNGITRDNPSQLQDRINNLMKVVIKTAGDKLAHLDIYDSGGIGTPSVTKYLAETIRKGVGDTPFLWHAHNDFGMATANALAAVEGGADWLDLVVNGLGDRAGNSALEEVAISLKCQYGIETGIKTEQLYQLSKLVERVTNVKVMWTKPVVGDFAWREDSHTSFLLQRRRDGELGSYGAYNPALVGQRLRIVFGKTCTNPPTVKWLCDDMGLKYTEEDVEQIVWAAMKAIDVRAEAGEDRFLLEHEIRDLCRKIIVENSQIKRLKRM